MTLFLGQLLSASDQDYHNSAAMPRGRGQRAKYRQPSEDERRAIIRAHLKGEDYVEVAGQLNIKRGTAWSIIAKYLRSSEATAKPRGGQVTEKLDQESRDLLVICIEENPQLTLKQLKVILEETWPHKPHVSTTTITRALHGCCITVKKVVPQPAERNSERIKEDRFNFAHWMITQGIARHRIYIDESGFNIHLMRTRGRSAAGERAIRTVCGSRGKNVTFITAISDRHPVGLIYHETVDGGVDRDQFADFIQSVSAILGENEEATLIFDNAPSHRSVENHVDLPATHQLRRLPAYSPFLNPIENVFSVMKAATKQHRAANQHRIDNRQEAALAGATLAVWRKNILLDGIMISLNSVTQEKVKLEYLHANSFLPACAAREEITG